MIRNCVRVKRLGRIPYPDALRVQQEHVEDVLRRRPNGQTLLLVEHDPVYTVGIRSKRQYTDADVQRFRQIGADFITTNRGGLITFHGPGQLVVYPILDLNSFRAADASSSLDKNLASGGVKWYVAQLEAALIIACYEVGLKGACAPGFPKTGVWTRTGRKVASIGIHARDSVTSHGAALNCDVDLSWFGHVQPCGMEPSTMSSLSRELGRRVSVDQASDLFEAAFAECFQCDLMRD